MTAVAERARIWILCLGFGVFVPLGLLAKQSMATSFIVLSTLLLVTGLLGDRRALVPNKSLAWSFVALCLYIGLTHLVVIDCEPCAGKAAGKLAMLGLIVWVVSSRIAVPGDDARRPIAIALSLGLGIALVLLIIELSTDSATYRVLTGRQDDPDVPLFRYNRGTSALVLLAWPAAAWLWTSGKRGWAGGLIAASIAGAAYGDSGAATVASILALVTAAVAALAPMVTFWTGLIALAGFTAAAPVIFSALLGWTASIATTLPPSTLDRIEIWHRSATAAFEAPWLGHGIGVSRHLPLPADLAARYTHLVKPPTHPHDAAIQLWLELGGLGTALFAVLIWFAVKPVRSLPGVWRIATLAAGAGIAFTALVAYGLWQETWLGIIAMTILAFRVLVPGPAKR